MFEGSYKDSGLFAPQDTDIGIRAHSNTTNELALPSTSTSPREAPGALNANTSWGIGTKNLIDWLKQQFR